MPEKGTLADGAGRGPIPKGSRLDGINSCVPGIIIISEEYLSKFRCELYLQNIQRSAGDGHKLQLSLLSC